MSFGTTRLPRISAAQFATMVTAGYFGLGIFYFPRPLVGDAGRLGIYGLWIDGLVAYFLMRLMFRMNRIIPNETFSGFAGALLSKPVGYLWATFTIVYHLALAVSATVLFSMVIGNIFLPTTPIWAIDGALVATASYMALGGTSALARLLQATYTPMALLSLLSVVLAVSLVRYPILMWPSTDIKILPILHGAWHQFLIFIGFQVSVTLYPFIRNEDRRKAERYAYLALAGQVFILTVMYELVISVFGPALSADLRWPLVSVFRIITVQGFFVTKLGFLVIMTWTIIIAAFAAVRIWCLAHDSMVLLKGVKGYTYKRAILAIAILTLAIALTIPNAKIADLADQTYLIPFGVLYLTLTPFVVLTVATFRQKKVEELRTLSEIGQDQPWLTPEDSIESPSPVPPN